MPKSNGKAPYIGSFVLETLTTGMYGESRNALREYVQNAFDAVCEAVAAGMLRERAAKIEVLLKDPNTLVIHDNGIGVGASSAWGTLTAVGASKKDRKRDAGFRGIGRLAGIAFCDTLSFRTKAAGESTETTVTFDCLKLREGMSPESGGGTQLVDLLSAAVSATTTDELPVDEHYMEVALLGLSHAPDDFKDLDQIREYLAETAPIGYDPKWEWGKKIKAYGDELQRPLEVVKLLVGRTSQDAKQIYKLYRDSYPAKGEAVTLTDVEFHQKENWWGWIGLPDRAVTITDPLVHGLRIRVKNIQVGGPEHLDAVFGRRAQSYIRFNKYYVGEIHVAPTALVPNARRDGFEDDAAWAELRDELYAKLKHLGLGHTNFPTTNKTASKLLKRRSRQFKKSLSTSILAIPNRAKIARICCRRLSKSDPSWQKRSVTRQKPKSAFNSGPICREWMPSSVVSATSPASVS